MDTKSPHYAIIVDKKRNDIMASMYSAVCQVAPAKILFNIMINQLKIEHSEVTGFIDEWTNKEHEMGWCNDPKCEKNKPQK